MTSSSSESPINPTDNSSSPYHLYNADNPGIALVTQLLTGDNYHAWSRSMRIALRSKNKLGFIDGSIILPSNASDPAHNAWLRCNDMVFSWLLNSVSKEIAASCIYINTARELWCDLQQRYLQTNAPRIFQLQKEIGDLMQDDLSLAVEYENNALIVKVDTDDVYEFARDMQVRGLPTLFFISPDPNKDAIQTEGLIPIQMMRDIIENEM